MTSLLANLRKRPNFGIADAYDIYDILWSEYAPNQDFSGAWYDGDYSLTLEQAQQRKRELILCGMGFKEGFRVLDIGCGWGHLVHHVNQSRGRGVGITLSPKQEQFGLGRGLDVRLLNWKDEGIFKLGAFDAITSVGSFEHFINLDQAYLHGTRDEVYGRYFETCHKLLRPGSAMFLQTMVFTEQGEEIAHRFAFDREEPIKGTDDYLFYLISHFYPNSCLANGFENIERCARPYFEVTQYNSGRKDYMVTMREWRKMLRSASPFKKIKVLLKAAIPYLSSADVRLLVKSNRYSAQTKIFLNGLFEHYRIFLKRKDWS